MWISNFAIRKPVVTTVVMMALVVFGAIALVLLETDEFPEVNPPVISVTIAYPGASPETVERELVDQLEEAFTSITGVDEMSSLATDSFAQIIVTFDFDKDLQEASQDIRDKISEVRNDLPTEMEEPTLTRFDPNDIPIVSLTLSSDTVSRSELSRLADPGLKSALRGVEGVADVKIVGGYEREMGILLHPEALHAAGIGIGAVIQAIEAGNLAAPVGRIEGQLEERTIRLLGRLEDPQQFAQIIVARSEDRTVHLGDVADIRDTHERPLSLTLFNGRPAVGIDIIKATTASTTAVSSAIGEQVRELRRTLPAGVKLNVVRDAGERVGRSVHSVQSSLFEGALLTVLVVLVFLASWRSTVITGLALPVSVLASFIAVWAFGFTLNTMSLLGLSLAIGILIDDAIVVRENIVRHMEMGKDHVAAARDGTSEIGLAVAATTFSIVVVFVPIAFMGGIAQQWFAPFALTIASSVLVSLFVSFSLDPMLSALWPDPEIVSGKRSWLSRRLRRFDTWFERQTGRYKRVIGWALRHRKTVMTLAVASFVIALVMPACGLIGSEFFPATDRSELLIKIETPPGSSLEYTRRKVVEASRIARADPGVAYTYTTIGGELGNVDEATMYVRLLPRAERSRRQQVIEGDLRGAIQRASGVTATLMTGGFGAEKQIQVQITGPNIDVLNRLAKDAMARIRRVPGAVDVGLSTRGERPELDVSVDRDLAAVLGITVGQVGQALRAAFEGIDSGDWIDPSGETRDVTVRLAPAAKERATDVGRIPLIVGGQQGPPVMVSLDEVADITTGIGPARIEHLDGKRVITIGANTAAGMPLSAVIGGIQQRLSSLALPAGYAIKQGGQTEDQREVFGRIFLALGVALMLMYLILVIQFNSFLDPIPIMASLPLSLIGVMLAMLVTGSTLNLMSMIGVILLMGIVAKNAILLLDFAKWTAETGVDRKTAIVSAGGVRLRPIIMTSIAIIAGMLPVAIGGGEGGDFRAPLGRAVIGGIITSTLLTLLVIPTFYDMTSGLRDRVRGAIERRRHHHPRARIHSDSGDR